jgi:hypothetical protein
MFEFPDHEHMIRILFLFLLSSCSLLFHKGPDYRQLSHETLLDSLPLTGAGRGRLEVDGKSYVFSFESAYLSENDQWGLSASFPFYGEEVLIYKNIKTAKIIQVQKFEKRLLESMPPQWHKQFQQTSRELVRFLMAKKLGIARNCVAQSDNNFECKVENDTFSVEVQREKITVTKRFKNFSISYSGVNLTESFFDRTALTVVSYDSQETPNTELNLELFWSEFQ